MTDYVFDGFTDMDKNIISRTKMVHHIQFGCGYFNLGAGAETGIYYGKDGDLFVRNIFYL